MIRQARTGDTHCNPFGTQVEDKMRRFKGECAQFIFNKCPIYTHDGASANFSTNSQETDNGAVSVRRRKMTGRSQTPAVVAGGRMGKDDIKQKKLAPVSPLLVFPSLCLYLRHRGKKE
jgi:hypothetical protein